MELAGIFWSSLFICGVLILLIYFVQGSLAVSGRRYLILGAELAKKGEFNRARRAIIIAARQNPALKRNVDVQNLYETILAESTDRTASEVDALLLAIPTWKKTTAEIVIESEAFKVGMVLLWIVWLLEKLMH